MPALRESNAMTPETDTPPETPADTPSGEGLASPSCSPSDAEVLVYSRAAHESLCDAMPTALAWGDMGEEGRQEWLRLGRSQLESNPARLAEVQAVMKANPDQAREWIQANAKGDSQSPDQ